MPGITTEIMKVKVLLDAIDANPEIFLGLEDKKVSPALLALQCNSLENLAHSINGLDKTIKMVLKRVNTKALKVLFQEGEEVEDEIS